MRGGRSQLRESRPAQSLGFGFGSTNVGLWEMALALEAGEPDRAVSVADHPTQRHPFKIRQSQYWMDYGRALVRLPRRSDDAVIALRKAEQLFPIRVQRNPFARDVIGKLFARSRRDAVGRELQGDGLPGWSAGVAHPGGVAVRQSSLLASQP